MPVRFEDHILSSNFPYKFKEYTNKDFIGKESYAYGFVTNLFNTNILMLDFDVSEFSDVMFAVETIIDSDIPVEQVDIAISSRCRSTLSVMGYHVYLGLNKSYNITDFFKLDIPNACKGYMGGALIKQETVLRISKKFNNKTRIISDIKWKQGFSKEDKTWLKYGSEQLIAPLTTVDGLSSSIILPQARPRLQLRG